jgi:hypothetical protein
MNQTAAAAFEACRERRTVPQLAAEMRETLNRPVTEEIALAAIDELERVGLVACSGMSSGERSQTSRRSVLRAVAGTAATAAPLVFSLSIAEQRAFAQAAGSGAPSISAGDLNHVCTQDPFPLNLNLVGKNTHFDSTSIVTFIGVPNIHPNFIVMVDATHMTIQVFAGDQPGSGTFDVKVVTGSESVTGVDIFSYGPTGPCG